MNVLIPNALHFVCLCLAPTKVETTVTTEASFKRTALPEPLSPSPCSRWDLLGICKQYHKEYNLDLLCMKSATR